MSTASFQPVSPTLSRSGTQIDLSTQMGTQVVRAEKTLNIVQRDKCADGQTRFREACFVADSLFKKSLFYISLFCFDFFSFFVLFFSFSPVVCFLV